MRVVFHPAADAEFSEAVAYYAALDPALGQRFYQEIERLIHEIARYPKTFRQFDPPTRRHLALGFLMELFIWSGKIIFGLSPSCRCSVARVIGKAG